MYELNYVKKKKRRKIVAIATGISGVVVATLAIVSFLGRFVGTFTVRLETGKVALALSNEKSFETSSSFLRVGDLPSLQETTYSSILNIGEDVIDSEKTNYLYGANYARDGVTVTSLRYFKYTFYVKNVGHTVASYDLAINIVDSKANDDGRMIDDTLRLMLYNNEADIDHQKTVYAKRSATHHIDKDGNVSFKEPISISEYDSTAMHPFMGYAEMFESSSRITTLTVNSFQPGEIKRYTLVFWLEGYDPQSSNLDEAPTNAKIKLGVEINAYEN